jgi:hypothetical protein
MTASLFHTYYTNVSASHCIIAHVGVQYKKGGRVILMLLVGKKRLHRFWGEKVMTRVGFEPTPFRTTEPGKVGIKGRP